MITEANVWVDELGTDQCWRLLARAAIGREPGRGRVLLLRRDLHVAPAGHGPQSRPATRNPL